MSFIKIYDENVPDGYVNCKTIKYFDIEYNKGDYQGDEHYIIRAREEEDNLRDDWVVSPKIYDENEAIIFLDSLIEKLRF